MVIGKGYPGKSRVESLEVVMGMDHPRVVEWVVVMGMDYPAFWLQELLRLKAQDREVRAKSRRVVCGSCKKSFWFC